jgi:ribonuclease D
MDKSFTLVNTAEALIEASQRLQGVQRIALDCEAAGFHRYSDRLCLVQLSSEDFTLLLDPLAVDLSETLRPILEDPQVQVVMHGADFDLRLLDRDLEINLRGLFDTQAAASLLGAPAIGLAALLEEHLDIKLSKAHQRADWAQRPLSEGMLVYAASDTRYLMTLADILLAQLQEKGRVEWVGEEFELLEAIRWNEEGTGDPIIRVKGAKDLSPRHATALREAITWRDEIAQARDKAPFRIAGDQVLMAVVLERPEEIDDLADMKGISPRLAQKNGRDLFRRLESVDELAEDDLVPYPRLKGYGFGRPTQEEEALANRIRNLRTERAEGLEVDRGVLLSNAQIMEIVRRNPTTMAELEEIPGVRGWQAEEIGTELLEVVKKALKGG